MPTDRFKELQENIEKYGDGVDLSIINHFAVIDMEAAFLGEFFDQVDVLRSNIKTISRLINDIEYLQHAMLALKIISGTQERLEEKMSEVKLLGDQVRKELNRMKQVRENHLIARERNVSQRIIECQLEEMTKTFCMMMDKYYQSVISYHQRRKERLQRQFLIAGCEKTDEEIEEILKTGRLIMYPEIIIKTKKAQEKLDFIDLRHEELLGIEESVLELHEMYFLVTELVTSQGEQIQNIEETTKATADLVNDTIPIIPAKRVSRCFPFKKTISLIIITAILIALLILKIITF